MNGTLLLVDDNRESLGSLELAFARSDYRVLAAPNGQQAKALLDEEPVDVLITDLKMPGIDGMELLTYALSLPAPPQVILLTAFGTVESAVEALRQGAFHYLTKPVNLKELRAQVEKAMDHHRLFRENERLKAELNERFGFEGVVGETPEMLDLMNKVRLIAGSRATVLLQGESGTGKELIARAIHNNGPRRHRPFAAVHCAAIPETLMESELFGHEKGAFTGAIARTQGRFEQANGGTLFLDEVGEIPLSMQVKLLRVLETLEFRRVGGIEPIHVDVRLIAATNRNLADEVARGAFREDLYYRLNVVTLHMPPLRRRLSDIPLLTRAFVETFAREAKRPTPKIDHEALKRLTNYHWPGNIRELRNVVENMIVFLGEDETIGVSHLPPQFAQLPAQAPAPQSLGFGQTLEEAESLLIRQALDAHEGNRTRAAETLGISRRTLQRKIKEMKL
ncbi:MAG: sigma-54 dependent transcriptional regulator [Candidatus Sumerlaeota bacterium]|nr:sigma-54 dependent transcriptional regulator [Candidatus Sumerlaeota bacterium]